MRERGFTYQIRPDGKVSNFYNALITNKSSENQSIKITSSLGEIIKVNQDEEIKAGEKTEWKFFIVADPDKVQEGRNMISINFYKNSNIVRTEEISFLAPGKGKKE